MTGSLFVQGYPVFPVGQFPGGMKDQFGPLLQGFKGNFVDRIGGTVIIRVGAIEIKNDRDIIFSKIPMI